MASRQLAVLPERAQARDSPDSRPEGDAQCRPGEALRGCRQGVESGGQAEQGEIPRRFHVPVDYGRDEVPKVTICDLRRGPERVGEPPSRGSGARPIREVSPLRLHRAGRCHVIERPEEPAGSAGEHRDMRAFVRLRQMLASHAGLARRLDELERKYDEQFREVFDALRALMTPLASRRRRIGFHQGGEENGAAAGGAGASCLHVRGRAK